MKKILRFLLSNNPLFNSKDRLILNREPLNIYQRPKKSNPMKKVLLLLLAGSGLCAQSGWQVLNTATPESFNTTYITSSGTVFIGSDDGNIYSSTDGGTTWDTATTAAQDGIADITFISSTEAWAVGDDGLILNSTDGGSTWSSVTSGASSNLESIFFVNSTTAYIAGRDGTILKSTNGGTSWTSQTSGSSDRLESVFFTSATRGFVAGRDGAFLETSNGGTTWSSLSLGSDDNKEVFFLDADTGFVGGENGIFKTTDGGTTWNATSVVGLNEINALHFGSSTHGYAVGEMGEIGKTADGGNNWSLDTTIASIGLVELNDVYFMDANNGFAVGDGGTILRHLGSGTPPANFCNASYWVDTMNSGNSNVYLINNSTPNSSSFINVYNWDFGDGSTSSQKYPIHTYAQPGAYGVCLTLISTDANGTICTDTHCDTVGLDAQGNLLYKNASVAFTLNVIDSTSVGQSEFSLGVDGVYPNPAKDKIHLALPASWEGTEVQLMTTSGKVVRTLDYIRNETMDVADLPRGLYLLRVVDPKQNRRTEKVILY